MDKPKSNADFRMMALTYKVRDHFRPREDILSEVGIEQGFRILDYGCGPGGYIAPLAKLVGVSGKIYALDIHPLAIRMVRAIAAKRGLANVETIQSGCRTGLPDKSVDVVLLFDVLHALSEPHTVLAEVRRVLKPDGILSINDPHMDENEIISKVTNGRMFRLSRIGKKTASFARNEKGDEERPIAF
jgi:ubiquinone/menaquinone biosynthesis C-methylase UbiE